MLLIHIKSPHRPWASRRPSKVAHRTLLIGYGVFVSPLLGAIENLDRNEFAQLALCNNVANQ